MGRIALLLFVVVPIAEIWLLITIGERIGFWPTIAFVLGVGLVGSLLARAEGMRVVRGIQQAMREGRVPEEGMLSGLLVLAGGILLVLPGLLTDAAGVLLLFPPTRRLVGRWLYRWMERKIAQGKIVVVESTGSRLPKRDDDDVIDV